MTRDEGGVNWSSKGTGQNSGEEWWFLGHNPWKDANPTLNCQGKKAVWLGIKKDFGEGMFCEAYRTRSFLTYALDHHSLLESLNSLGKGEQEGGRKSPETPETLELSSRNSLTCKTTPRLWESGPQDCILLTRYYFGQTANFCFSFPVTVAQEWFLMSSPYIALTLIKHFYTQFNTDPNQAT